MAAPTKVLSGYSKETTMTRIGIIVAGSAYPIEGFKMGLRGLGWLEGENISLELRAAEVELRQLTGFATEMVALGVDAVAAVVAGTMRAVRLATQSSQVFL